MLNENCSLFMEHVKKNKEKEERKEKLVEERGGKGELGQWDLLHHQLKMVLSLA